MLQQLLACFNLSGLEDRRFFNKYEMEHMQTVSRLELIREALSAYYIPCKARCYLTELSEKRAITVLKQVLRLHHHRLVSYEKNISGKKVIFYRIASERGESIDLEERRRVHMTHQDAVNLVSFE